jgi:3-phenylpropionate/trans-cinnamate dioxygenase ferredoxin reductase component
MSTPNYSYIIVGAGLAGASAAEGIREIDKSGSVLLVGEEPSTPYNRPPLTKGLWTGKKKVQDIFVWKDDFISSHSIEMKHSTKIVSVNPDTKTIMDGAGVTYGFGKLLIATGGIPKRLPVPGGDLAAISYFRFLEDYLKVSEQAKEGRSAIIIGGGFIGTEIAAALAQRNLRVTMTFPEDRPCFRVFPDYLGNHILKMYRDRGITVLTNDLPVAVEEANGGILVRTKSGRALQADICIAGLGIAPETDLARSARLAIADGILVNSFLQTSHPDIYAAGDNAAYPEKTLGKTIRLEHWDNALNQGKLAGRNMAGAQQQYTYMPYFFSDLFDFGYEAVGEIDSRLQTRAEWKEENVKGIVYYLSDDRIRGVLLCNTWDKVDAARNAIKNNEPVS